MREPRWLSRGFVGVIHTNLLHEHGGRFGVRDEGLIASALERPRLKWSYEGEIDLADLAAAYGYGLVRNHGFVDGNKRIAFMAVYVFLGLNGFDLGAPEPQVVRVMLDLAASDLTESEFAAWIRKHLRSVVEHG